VEAPDSYKNWSGRGDLNARPPALKPAIPLHQRILQREPGRGRGGGPQAVPASAAAIRAMLENAASRN